MKIKTYLLPAAIIGIIILFALLAKGTFKESLRRNWDYESLKLKPNLILTHWKNEEFRNDLASIYLMDINRNKIPAVYEILKGQFDSLTYIESMNAGNPQSKSFKETFKKFLKHEVNEIIFSGKINGQRYLIDFSEQPQENAVGENIFTHKEFPPAITFELAPGEQLNGKTPAEKDSIIRFNFELIIKLANVCQASKICYQSESFMRILDSMKKNKTYKQFNCSEAILRNELR